MERSRHPVFTIIAESNLGFVLDQASQVDREDRAPESGRRVLCQHTEDVELSGIAQGLPQAEYSVPLGAQERIVGLLRHLHEVRHGASTTEADLVASILAHAVAHGETDHLGVAV